MEPIATFWDLPSAVRILIILGLAVLGHVVVQAIRRASEGVLASARAPGRTAKEEVAKRFPKFATVTSLVVSALTFLIYFGALGLILSEFRVDLRAYLATASVVGLALAFGLQGLVQDVVIGLTLVFTDAFDIGDMIEISGTGVTSQIGRVEKIGLRFTTLINFQGQRVFVPNRNIVLVSRFRRNVIRAYVDIQIPPEADEAAVRDRIDRLARGFRSQHGAVLVTEHAIFDILEAEDGGWRYLRLRFRLWPGQGALVEHAFRQRVIAVMKEFDPEYPDWGVTVTYRVQ